MNNILMQKILMAQATSGIIIELSITGVSMNPILYEGDIVSVARSDKYEIGDILVFAYKQNECLIHRLLEIKESRYFCKGDNAFRLEDITADQIIGKVINPPPCPKPLIQLSYLVNREFHKCKYDIERTKATHIYKLYEKVIVRKEESIMIYKKNENMDYIQADEISLVVFDPESGDTHFFDEIGIDILKILNDPCTIDILLTKLCEIYEANPNDICDDVQEFLNETISKKVIEII